MRVFALSLSFLFLLACGDDAAEGTDLGLADQGAADAGDAGTADAGTEDAGVLRGEALFQSERPLVVAHRGGRRLAPEHTLFGYQVGLDAGADVLEIDVAQTSDGAIVCIHDLSVDRTTDGTGDIRELTLAEAQALDAAFDFSMDGGETYPQRGTGIVIPTLRAVFEAFPDETYVIEIKQSEPSMVDDFVAL
ncbi:MAG: glycerophosphodiester phosphodiesterase family protein, partial [Myxococcota bacterium]